MAVRSQQQDIEAKRFRPTHQRRRKARGGTGHEGRSGVGVTELIDVGVKKDLVRADVVLLKSCGVSMVAVGEALGSPVAVDGAVGVLGSSSR